MLISVISWEFGFFIIKENPLTSLWFSSISFWYLTIKLIWLDIETDPPPPLLPPVFTTVFLSPVEGFGWLGVSGS